jgi:rhodanese-related sulfurtransferase
MNQAMFQAAMICGITAVASLVTWLLHEPSQDRLHCDPSALAADQICIEQVPLDAKLLWVDARSRQLWMRNGMPGSVLWNLDPAEDMNEFEAAVAMRLLDSPQVIVYCDDEQCGISRQVAERIRALGLGAEVSILFGGWEALAAAGLVRSDQNF